MRWWEYLLFWRGLKVWWLKRRQRALQEEATEAAFKAVLHEAEERRGDLQLAVDELREARQQRQIESIRISRTEPAHQE